MRQQLLRKTFQHMQQKHVALLLKKHSLRQKSFSTNAESKLILVTAKNIPLERFGVEEK